MEGLIKELRETLNSEMDIYNKLLKITETKTEIIKSGHAKELDKITQVEQVLILNIGKLENAREAIVDKIKSHMGITEEITMTKLIEDLDEDLRAEIEPLGQELLKVLMKIKEINDLNSILINDSLDYINFNINILANTLPDTTYSGKVNKEAASQKKSLFDAKA